MIHEHKILRISYTRHITNAEVEAVSGCPAGFQYDNGTTLEIVRLHIAHRDADEQHLCALADAADEQHLCAVAGEQHLCAVADAADEQHLCAVADATRKPPADWKRSPRRPNHT